MDELKPYRKEPRETKKTRAVLNVLILLFMVGETGTAVCFAAEKVLCCQTEPEETGRIKLFVLLGKYPRLSHSPPPTKLWNRGTCGCQIGIHDERLDLLSDSVGAMDLATRCLLCRRFTANNMPGRKVTMRAEEVVLKSPKGWTQLLLRKV